jgi:hypothetical protein
MATPGELVHTVANALGIPEATIVQIDRNLVDAGLRSKGGRGRSAAQVKSEDAANLLIAIGGAPISGAAIKETRKICDRFAPLQATRRGKPASFLKLKPRLPTLGKLPPGHSFRDAIVALIDSAAAREFDPSTPLYIDFESPRARGSISVNGHLIFYGERHEGDGDLRQTRRISEVTFNAIVRLLTA